MCGLAILIVVIYPLWVCIFMHLNVEKFEDKEFKQKYGFLYEQFKTETPDKKRNAILIQAFFFTRRFILALTCVLLLKQPIFYQWVISMTLSLISIFMQTILKPYNNKISQIFHLYNELVLLMTTYFQILFTSLTKSAELRYYTAWYIIVVVGQFIAANILHTSITACVSFYRQKVKQWFLKLKQLKNKPKTSQKQIKNELIDVKPQKYQEEAKDIDIEII